MTTNQEGRQAAIRESTSTAYGVAADWNALFDDAGISAGTFNERLLAWINDQLGTSYSNLLGAMAAYAADAGYNAWSSISTLVLGGASTLLSGETDGLAFDFTDSSARIKDTSTPANEYSSTGIVSSGSLVGPSGKLTYTSPSNKLTMQSDGVMRYQAHNLYLNSAAPANQSITVVSGASYAVTITGAVSVTASGAATGTWTAGTNTFTAATTTLTLGSTSGSGTVHVRRTPSNDDYIETAGAAKYALPLEYSATDGSCLGLLAEEQRTNLLTYSTDFANAAWSPDHDGSAGLPTVTSNTTVAPDGTTTADTLAVPAVSGAQWSYVTHTAVCTAVAHTMSVWLKGAVGGETVYLAITPDGVNYVSRSCTLTTEWQRFDVTGTLTNATWYYLIGTDLRDGTQSATSAQTFYVWQAQIEVGSFATSPILTYGAAATRNADPLSQLTSTFPLSATAGSFYAYVAPYAGADLAGIVSLNDGTGNEEIVIYKDASANIVAQVEDGGVNQLAPLDSTVNASSGTAFKVALAWAANDFALSVDGTAAQTDTGGTLPTVTTLEIGVDQANNYFNGHIKAISYVPRRKSNAELQAETA